MDQKGATLYKQQVITKMKLPSINSLLQSALQTLKRFPLAILFAIAGSIVLVKIVSLPYDNKESIEYLWKVVMTCYLGMLLFIAISIYNGRRNLRFKQEVLINLIGLIFITAYYFSLPVTITQIAVLRLILFALALHLLISFIPYLVKNEMNGFWQYNKILFLRFLTSSLYTIVLYLGLILAVFAVENLFKVNIDSNLYAYIWIVLAGIFNTWFFLAGIPISFAALESNQDYPKGLKIFTQYVLLPLTTVYLLILYAYGLKIIFDGQWPEGWVSYLVIGFFIGGILSLLLIYPIRNKEENKWVLFFSRIFYIALFPLIIMLYFAIKRRINDYGLTEPRYFVLVLAIWLLLIVLYFLFSKQKNIKLIPISLCAFALIITYGPLSAFNRSLSSQQDRLEKVLSGNQLLKNGTVIPVRDTISFNDRKQISSITEYIIESHGIQELQPLFSQNLDSIITSNKSERKMSDYDQTNAVLSLMHLKYVGSYETESSAVAEFYGGVHSEKESLRDIRSYDYSLYLENEYGDVFSEDSCKSFLVSDQIVWICYLKTLGQLSIYREGSKDSSLNLNISQLLKSLPLDGTNSNTYDAEMLSIKSENSTLGVKIFFENLTYTELNNSVDFAKFKSIYFNGDLMIKMK